MVKYIYENGDETVIIPEGIEIIGNGAFYLMIDKAVVKHYLPDTDKTEETVETNMKSHEILQKAFYLL